MSATDCVPGVEKKVGTPHRNFLLFETDAFPLGNYLAIQLFYNLIFLIVLFFFFFFFNGWIWTDMAMPEDITCCFLFVLQSWLEKQYMFCSHDSRNNISFCVHPPRLASSCHVVYVLCIWAGSLRYSLHIWITFVLSICCLLAEQSANQRDFEKAIRFYKDALVYNDNDTKVGFVCSVEKHFVFHIDVTFLFSFLFWQLVPWAHRPSADRR